MDLITPCPTCHGPMVLDVDTDRAYCDTQKCSDYGAQLTWLELLALIYPGRWAPAMEVHQVPPGSIVVLRDVQFDTDTADQVTAELARIVGHSRFALLTSEHGACTVWGPDTDLTDQLTRLLQETTMGDHPNAITGTPHGADLVEAPRRAPRPDDPPTKHRIPVTGTEDEDQPDA